MGKSDFSCSCKVLSASANLPICDEKKKESEGLWFNSSTEVFESLCYNKVRRKYMQFSIICHVHSKEADFDLL